MNQEEIDTINRWEKIAQEQLLNRKIVGVRYMTPEEQKQLGWYSKALILLLDDGNMIFPSADDEGNGAGALFTNHETEDILPVI